MIRRTLTLFGTDGCHLCEEAEALLEAMGRRNPGAFEWCVIDIAGSDGLVQEYGVRIPVLRHGSTGRELAWPFDGAILDAFLKTLT